MTEREVHLELSNIKIDNDNLDYIKMTGEICGKLRDDLVKLFAIPVVVGRSEQLPTRQELDEGWDKLRNSGLDKPLDKIE